MVHHEKCPLCSSEKISQLFRCYDFFLSKKEFPVFKCSDCNFIFTQDYPEENEIGRYYDSAEYISHTDSSEGLLNKLYRFVRNIMLTRKMRLVFKSTGLKRGNLLDIGSGTGYFAGKMKSEGWNVKGIEVSDKARQFSITRFGIDVISPEHISSLEKESFDCITLWHVLEHFHDPFGYISRIKNLLKPGGFCIIALPNSSSYDAEYYKEYWAAWDVPRHLWHFSPDTFGQFCENNGMRINKIKKLPFDVFYISGISEKYKGSSCTFLRGMINASLFAFFSIFNLKKSSSIIYILSKEP